MNPHKKKANNLNYNNKRPKPKTVFFRVHSLNTAGNNLSVYRETFLNILNKTKHRVLGVFQHFNSSCGLLVPVETRVQPKKKGKNSENKLKAVVSFINRLRIIESHYACGKSTRIYLSSDLT